jgi:hypothetical protein
MRRYSADQRAIIDRIGNISKRIRETAAAHRATHETHVAIALDLAHALNNSAIALRQAEEMLILATEHGDAFREFIDTL